MASKTIALCVLTVLITGCSQKAKKQDDGPRPRPVTVLTLKETNPARLTRLSGTVSSWKTEDIGFEVEGRVEFVIEPDTQIEGRIRTVDNKLIGSPTKLATLNKTRYDLRVASEGANVEATKKKEKSVEIEAKKVVPQEVKAAEAEVERAQDDLKRTQAAFDRKAVTEADLKAKVANEKKAVAYVAQLKAKQEAKSAERVSLESQIKQAEQALAEAEQDVKDCTLYSPFRGRVTQVHVIPGGYVRRGDKVVTIQMMQPIKVDVEVSAETDRRIGYEDTLKVHVIDADGNDKEVIGMVYQKSSTADPATRTYTVTLLVQNEYFRTPVPPELKGNPHATTRKLWLLAMKVPRQPGYYAIDAKAIHQDKQGHFVWKVRNRTTQTPARNASDVLEVEKLRVIPGEIKASLLGLVTLTPVKIVDESKFRRNIDFIVGEIFPKGAESFSGGKILLEQSRWMLRPGDVVGVDVGGVPQSSGFYVPINAIREQSGKTSVFVAAPGKKGSFVARQVPVRAYKSTGTLMRIVPLKKDALKKDMRVILGGVHFLVDGEPVAVAKEVEVRR